MAYLKTERLQSRRIERSYLSRLCFECRTTYSPFGAIIGSLLGELQSLKAEFMPNRVADRPRFGLYREMDFLA